jgi:predicted nucleic acid-binding protein
MLNALRKAVLRDELGIDRASDARDDFADLALSQYPNEPFIDRIWDLRHALSAYDAAYLALAEAISIPLILRRRARRGRGANRRSRAVPPRFT